MESSLSRGLRRSLLASPLPLHTQWVTIESRNVDREDREDHGDHGDRHAFRSLSSRQILPLVNANRFTPVNSERV